MFFVFQRCFLFFSFFVALFTEDIAASAPFIVTETPADYRHTESRFDIAFLFPPPLFLFFMFFAREMISFATLSR
jgi:hypothetical protein